MFVAALALSIADLYIIIKFANISSRREIYKMVIYIACIFKINTSLHYSYACACMYVTILN